MAVNNLMRRNVIILAVCLALMMSATSLVIITSALVGAILAPNRFWATVPLACMFIGSLSSAFPASLLMKRIGRRAGFSVGLGFALVGAIVATLGLLENHFVVFCVGSLLIGLFNGFGQFYRFAAADAASEAYRSRAISWVLAGGVLAAFVGPNLANWSQYLIVGTRFAGSYASLLVLYLLSLGLIAWIRIPKPSAEERTQIGRPLSQIMMQPIFVVAALSAVAAYSVMNLIMTSTPLAMDNYGHQFEETAWVIQWHILGMYAPSFVTGHLIRRFSCTRVMAVGTFLLGLCVVVNLHGQSVPHFWLALVLLGLGWNFLFIGGTTLVTEAYMPAEKAKTQGLNDFLVFGMVALTALTSGMLHQWLGWLTLNIVVVPMIVVALIAVIWLDRVQNRVVVTST
jgi:predicted MFS family arabinose efflux permease